MPTDNVEQKHDHRYEVSGSDRGAFVHVVMADWSDWLAVGAACGVIDRLQIRWRRQYVSTTSLEEVLARIQSEGPEIVLATYDEGCELARIASPETLPTLMLLDPWKNASLTRTDALRPGKTLSLFFGTAGMRAAALTAAKSLATHDDGLEARIRAYVENRARKVPVETVSV